MIAKDKLENRLIMGLTIFMVISFYIFELKSWGRYVIFVVAVAIFLINALNNQMKVNMRFEAYHYFILAFIIDCFMSVLWAWNSALAFSKSVTLLLILACMSMIYPYFRKRETVDDLLKIFLLSGYFLCVYTVFYYGRSDVMSYLTNNVRIGNDFTNSNALGLVAAVSIIIQVYYIINKKANAWAILMVPTIVVLAISQSRKAIIMVVAGVAFLISTNSSNKNIGKKVLSIIGGIVALLILLYLLSNIPIFSGVMKRFTTLFESMNGQRAEDIRSIFRRIGMEQFWKTPVLGIGIGNSLELLGSSGYNRTYLHSNMVELLACMGIVGFSLYYSIYFYLGYKLFKYRKYDNGITNLCFVLLVMMFIMDYGQVTYYDKVQYLYFMCFFLNIKCVEQKIMEEDIMSESYEDYIEVK